MRKKKELILNNNRVIVSERSAFDVIVASAPTDSVAKKFAQIASQATGIKIKRLLKVFTIRELKEIVNTVAELEAMENKDEEDKG